MNRKLIRIYKSETGSRPFEKWLKTVKCLKTRGKIRYRIDKLEMGYYGDCKTLSNGLKELRFNFGPGYRVYFAEVDEIIIVLLFGGKKDTQSRDINLVKKYWDDLRRRGYD